MERYAAIILLLLLAGCMTPLESTNTTQNQSSERTAIRAHVDVGIVNGSESKGSVIFIVSDNEKAARTSMKQGQEIWLPMNPRIDITLEKTTGNTATFTINDETKTIAQGEDAVFEDGKILLYVART